MTLLRKLYLPIGTAFAGILGFFVPGMIYEAERTALLTKIYSEVTNTYDKIWGHGSTRGWAPTVIGFGLISIAVGWTIYVIVKDGKIRAKQQSEAAAMAALQARAEIDKTASFGLLSNLRKELADRLSERALPAHVEAVYEYAFSAANILDTFFERLLQFQVALKKMSDPKQIASTLGKINDELDTAARFFAKDVRDTVEVAYQFKSVPENTVRVFEICDKYISKIEQLWATVPDKTVDGILKNNLTLTEYYSQQHTKDMKQFHQVLSGGAST